MFLVKIFFTEGADELCIFLKVRTIPFFKEMKCFIVDIIKSFIYSTYLRSLCKNRQDFFVSQRVAC